MQPPLLMPVQNHPTNTVHQALRRTRRPARINNQERIRELDPLERQSLIPLPRLEKLRPRHRPRDSRYIGRVVREARLSDQALKLADGVEGPHDLGHPGPQISRPAVVDRHIIHEQPLRPDLQQSVENAADAGVCAGAREEGAQTGGGEEDGEGVDAVARHGGDSVSFADAPGAHRVGESADPLS